MAVPKQEPPKKKKREFSYLLNPANWGVENLSEEESFNQAFGKARNAGLTEFIYNGRRYNTQSNESPNAQFSKFHNTNELLNANLSAKSKKNLLEIDDYLYRSGAVLPERIEGRRGEYFNDLLRMHQEYNNPSVDLEEAIGVPDGVSAYRPLTNSMFLSSPWHYFDELAHAKQDKESLFMTGKTLSELPLSLLANPYEIPGSLEYEAHKAIAPGLKFRMNYHPERISHETYDTTRFEQDPRYNSYYPEADEEPATKEDSIVIQEGQRLLRKDKADSTDKAESLKKIRNMKFRRGGKIMAEGGLFNDPKPKRKLSPEVLKLYSQKVPPMQRLADVEETDPLFYDQNEFNSYYRKKAVGRLNPEQLTTYNENLAISNDNADAILSSYGGIPEFAPYQSAVRTYEKQNIKNPTDWANLDSEPVSNRPRGYRYRVGKPAIGSITVPVRQSGGRLTNPPTKDDLLAAREMHALLPSKSNYSIEPWLNPDRKWYGGDTALGKGEDLYIDDNGDLKLKPKKKVVNPLFVQPMIQQDATRVSSNRRPMLNYGGRLKGPSHENGGIMAVDPVGRPVAEVEGGERLFSVEDTNEIESLIRGMRKAPSQKKAAQLGSRIKQMIELQDR